MPAYFFDSYRFRAHKMKGGTFQNYPDKSYLQLTDDQIARHLNGEQLVGLYPLLSDNTSWLIAADFDEGDWIASGKKFIQACNPINFSRILHDYSDERKGFVLWKDALEERLV